MDTPEAFARELAGNRCTDPEYCAYPFGKPKTFCPTCRAKAFVDQLDKAASLSSAGVAHGSCLLCGHDKPFVSWSGTVGVCADCRELWALAKAEADEGRALIARTVREFNERQAGQDDPKAHAWTCQRFVRPTIPMTPGDKVYDPSQRCTCEAVNAASLPSADRSEGITQVIAKWRECEAVNSQLALRHHHGDGWFTVYMDRRDIYKRCADELAASLHQSEPSVTAEQCRPYLQHIPTCQAVVGEWYTHADDWGHLSNRLRPSNKCTCGLDQLLAALAPSQPEQSEQKEL